MPYGRPNLALAGLLVYICGHSLSLRFSFTIKLVKTKLIARIFIMTAVTGSDLVRFIAAAAYSVVLIVY